MISLDPFLVMTTPAPALDVDRAYAVIHDTYGMSGTLKSLTSERDQNFLLAADHGLSCVLKIANSAEDPAITDFQSGALLHIEESAPELAVPRVIRTRGGSTSTRVTAADGREHTVRLISWLDGTPLQDLGTGTNCAAVLGTCLAELGQALRDYQHPASAYGLLWDLKQAAALRDLLDCVEDTDLRDTCMRRLDVFESRVLPQLDSVRWQVIHNDLNPSNVLVDDKATSVAGVIDFGDMIRSPLIIDVAVAAAYLLRDDDDPLADVLSFVAAYGAVEPLEEIEINLIFDLLLTRSTMTVLITHWRAARYPENREYILRNEERARKMLDLMHALPADGVTRRLLDAASIEHTG